MCLFVLRPPEILICRNLSIYLARYEYPDGRQESRKRGSSGYVSSRYAQARHNPSTELNARQKCNKNACSTRGLPNSHACL